jgi:hypothetical protein
MEKVIRIKKSDIEKLFNIDIAKIMNVSTERDSDTKNVNEIVVRYRDIKEQQKYVVKYRHIDFGFIGEVNENDNHLHFGIESGDMIFMQAIPMILIENSKDWELINS